MPIYWGGEQAVQKKMGSSLKGVLFFNNYPDLEDKLLKIERNEIQYNEIIDSVNYNFERLKEIRKEMKLLIPFYAIVSKFIGNNNTYHYPNLKERYSLLD